MERSRDTGAEVKEVLMQDLRVVEDEGSLRGQLRSKANGLLTGQQGVREASVKVEPRWHFRRAYFPTKEWNRGRADGINFVLALLMSSNPLKDSHLSYYTNVKTRIGATAPPRGCIR